MLWKCYPLNFMACLIDLPQWQWTEGLGIGFWRQKKLVWPLPSPVLALIASSSNSTSCYLYGLGKSTHPQPQGHTHTLSFEVPYWNSLMHFQLKKKKKKLQGQFSNGIIQYWVPASQTSVPPRLAFPLTATPLSQFKTSYDVLRKTKG